MKETKLKRLIKKMMDCIFLDAMTPEFKAANAELLKAIKMNDKSGAVPHADLEAVNKAMKENDADKAGAALKKVQLQFSKAEKKLDDDVKSIQAKLETTKKAAETAKASLKQKKALASVFDKLKVLVSGLSNNPKNASKLTALTDKVKDYGDLSKRASQIITLVSSNKDASKQIDMLKKSVDAAEKKFKKDLANAEKESKKADDALEVVKMQVKITQGKKDAFTKERLYIANVTKKIGVGLFPQDIPERAASTIKQKTETKENDKGKNDLIRFIESVGMDGIKAKLELQKYKRYLMKNKLVGGFFENKLALLIINAAQDYRQSIGAKERGDDSKDNDLTRDLFWCANMADNGNLYGTYNELNAIRNNNASVKKFLAKPINFINKIIKERENRDKMEFNGYPYQIAEQIPNSTNKFYAAEVIFSYYPQKKKEAVRLLNLYDPTRNQDDLDLFLSIGRVL